MAKVSGGAIRLIDKDGDPLDDGNGRLNINATLEAASVNIGDVDIRVGGIAASTGHGTVGVGTLRVTLASDTTGVLSVDDNGGSLTVDSGAFTTMITELERINSAIFNEDTASSSGERGMHVLTVRRNSVTSNSSTDGDYVSLGTDYFGALYTREVSTYSLDTFAMIDVDNAVQMLSDSAGVIASCHEIFLQADESNSGYVMVGDADVADNRGVKLNAGDTLILNTHDTRGVNFWGSADNQNLRCMIKYRITA